MVPASVKRLAFVVVPYSQEIQKRYLEVRDRVAGRTLALFPNAHEQRFSPRGIRRMVLRRGLAAGVKPRLHPHMLRHATAKTHLSSDPRSSLSTLDVVAARQTAEKTDRAIQTGKRLADMSMLRSNSTRVVVILVVIRSGAYVLLWKMVP